MFSLVFAPCRSGRLRKGCHSRFLQPLRRGWSCCQSWCWSRTGLLWVQPIGDSHDLQGVLTDTKRGSDLYAPEVGMVTLSAR